MGIRGLASCIAWVAQNSIHRRPLSYWKGKRIGIDILCLLYRSRTASIPLLWNLGNLFQKFRQYDIEAIAVFDGNPPPEKMKIVEARKKIREDSDKFCKVLENALSSDELSEAQKNVLIAEIIKSRKNVPQITGEDRDQVKQLLYALGIRFVHANGEADALLTYLEKRQLIDAVISTDMDFLARGVSHLLVPEMNNLENLQWYHYDLDAICQSMHLTQEQFREYACVLGTDYAPGVNKQTARLLYQRYKLARSLPVLMDRLSLSHQQREDIKTSLNELDISNKPLELLINLQQQTKLCRPVSVESEWIQEHIEKGELPRSLLTYTGPIATPINLTYDEIPIGITSNI